MVRYETSYFTRTCSAFITAAQAYFSKRNPLLEILLIARNVLIINTNWNGKMTKETN